MGERIRLHQNLHKREDDNAREVVCEFCGGRIDMYELNELQPYTSISEENPLEPESEFYFHKHCEIKFREQFKDNPEDNPITPVK